MPIRMAVIADIHGNLLALEAVLADIANRNVTRVVNLGDHLYGPLQPAGTAARLLREDIPAICGNQDRILLDRSRPDDAPGLLRMRAALGEEHRHWLASLPATLVLDEILFCHGTPRSDSKYLLEDVRGTGVFLRDSNAIASDLDGVRQRVIVCGHSHVPRTLMLPDERFIVNPGSVGLQAYTDDAPFPHAMEAGSPHARYAVLATHDSGQWSVEHIAVPYAWNEAARTALSNGRPDWAKSLTTGRAP